MNSKRLKTEGTIGARRVTGGLAILLCCVAVLVSAPRNARALTDPSAFLDPGCTGCFCTLWDHGETLFTEAEEILTNTMPHFGTAMPVIEFGPVIYQAKKAGSSIFGDFEDLFSGLRGLMTLGDGVSTLMDNVNSLTDTISSIFPIDIGIPSGGDMSSVTGALDDIEDKIDDVTDMFEGGPIAPLPEIGGRLGEYEMWMVNALYIRYMMPVFKEMNRQLTYVAMTHTAIMGAFLDAKTAMGAQLLLQKMTAQAVRKYTPSPAMCVLGTGTRSLGSSQGIADMTRSVLNEKGLARELSRLGDAASGPNSTTGHAEGGSAYDRAARFDAFKKYYCNRYDNNAVPGNPLSGLASLCVASSVTPETVNRDIDYVRTLLLPRTLDVDFGTVAVSQTERDVIALSDNLYAHRIMTPLTGTMGTLDENLSGYMDMRAVTAKRSVARNSFNTIVGMKARGSATSATTAGYMKILLRNISNMNPDVRTINNADRNSFEATVTRLMGDRPSYMAQMEYLAKKIYQEPQFYVDLQESPENVKRRSVAMQAIGLMLDRDIYNSQLRSEAIMSLILESKVIEAERDVQSSMGKVKK